MIAALRETQLVLAFRAVECRAPGLRDPGDDPTAIFPRARQSFAIVDFEDVLEIAQFTVGLPVIAQSRAAGLDGFLEHVADRLGDRRCGPGGGAACIR